MRGKQTNAPVARKRVDDKKYAKIEKMRQGENYNWASVNLVLLKDLAETDPEAAAYKIVDAIVGETPENIGGWQRSLVTKVKKIEVKRIMRKGVLNFPIICDGCKFKSVLAETDFTGWRKDADDDLCPDCFAKLEKAN
jgi:hypothetical protein